VVTGDCENSISALLAETRNVCASILCHEEGSFQGFLESAQPDRDPLPHPKHV
jgi:hypothetical protein